MVEEDIGIGMKKKMKAGGSDFDDDDWLYSDDADDYY
jgi:hypothetical protein